MAEVLQWSQSGCEVIGNGLQFVTSIPCHMKIVEAITGFADRGLQYKNIVITTWEDQSPNYDFNTEKFTAQLAAQVKCFAEIFEGAAQSRAPLFLGVLANGTTDFKFILRRVRGTKCYWRMTESICLINHHADNDGQYIISQDGLDIVASMLYRVLDDTMKLVKILKDSNTTINKRLSKLKLNDSDDNGDFDDDDDDDDDDGTVSHKPASVHSDLNPVRSKNTKSQKASHTSLKRDDSKMCIDKNAVGIVPLFEECLDIHNTSYQLSKYDPLILIYDQYSFYLCKTYRTVPVNFSVVMC